MFEIISTAYREYRDKILKNVFKIDIIKPYMNYKETAIIMEVLKLLQPKQCLEWGSGFSTLCFPKFLNKDARWLSIEHDKDWYLKIKGMNEKPNVWLRHVSPSHYPWTDEYGDGNHSDLKDYIDFPSRFGKFDFILIDGRARKWCLNKCNELIEHKGVIILHDANRDYYHEPFRLYRHQILFRDYRKDAGGLWIGSQGLKLEDLISVKYFKLWDSTLCKVLKI